MVLRVNEKRELRIRSSANFVGCVVGFINVQKILPNPPLGKEGLRKRFLLENSPFCKGGERGIWQICTPAQAALHCPTEAGRLQIGIVSILAYCEKAVMFSLTTVANFLIYSSQDIFISIFCVEGISHRRLSPSFGPHLTQPL
jgi:hypothetical protein